MASDSERPSTSPLVGTRTQTQTLGDKAFQGLANLIKLLPTGTLFIFQFLSPALTNYGKCYTSNKYLTVVALLTPNIVGCYYSSFESTQKTLLVVLPPVVGVISSTVFAVFPHMRHGIGYAPAQAAAAGDEA
ncbi:hypothetical protein MRB53_010817 [Persea americana]|uniref:Uncharacterized protein n=1 Tax=Persea americana TaxID=3435 RepID=A0ACC2LT27_PERAE|nr:hypothetical protein MRB53_010817 [Persea americana]